VLLAAAVLLVACQAQPAYFDFGSPTSRSAPIPPGEPAIVGTSVGEVRAGDRVTFVSLELTGLVGATSAQVEPLLAIVAESRSTIGIGAVRDVPPEIDVGAYRALRARSLASSDGPFAIAVRLTMPDHEVSFASARLTFRIGDGEPQTQTIPAAARLCPDHGTRPRCPAPTLAPPGARA
jgi:hypothetical protein